jgi:ankyrin repeat protein
MNIHIRDKTTDSSAIHWACMSGNYKIIEFLLENGANPNDIDDEFDSPLHALINGYYLEKHINQEEINNIVNLLVRYGANVNYQNRNGDTPLHFMIFTYSFSVINNIIEAGANVTIMNNQNETPLDTALSEGRLIDSRIISILH